MSKFFEYYKTTEYEILGKKFKLTNITLRYKFKQNLTKNVYNFYDYTLQDGERLDHVADMYYGSSKYVWVIVLANEMIDPLFDIPRPYNEFRKYLINKYGDWETVESGNHHYERVSVYKDETTKITDLNPPITVNQETYNNLFEKERRIITNLEYEDQINENKRTIKLLDSSQLNLIIELVEGVFE